MRSSEGHEIPSHLIRRKNYGYVERHGYKQTIHPSIKKDVEVLALEGEIYLSTGIFSDNQILQSKLLPDFSIQVKQFFR